LAWNDAEKQQVRNLLDGACYALKKIRFKDKINGAKTKKVLREVKALARLDHYHVCRYFHGMLSTSHSPS
jgi:serine/threonine protein kinase